MAHLVETMAYAAEGGTPWHGLGTPVSSEMTPEEMGKAAGLDWTLEKLPVYLNFKGEWRKVEGKLNLTRMTDGAVMDVVSPLYKHVQPEQALGFFKRFTEAGHMKMETAGSLDNGKRIWALASIQASFTLKGGDTVRGYLLLCSPNKAGESMTIKFCAERVVCHNTLTMALREGTKTVRLNHLTDFTEARQEEACEALGIALDQMNEFQEQAELLASKKAERQAVLNYVAAISGSKILETMVTENAAVISGNVLESMVAAEEGAKVARQIEEADLNRVGKTILDAITNSPGAEMESAAGTWWGVLNGVTYATDHKLGRDGSRLSSAWYGEKATMKQKAIELAVEYATAGTPTLDAMLAN